MMNQFFGGDSIPAQLSHKSIWRWFGNIFFDWGIIVAAYIFAFLFQTWWAYLGAIIVIGTRQQALSILAHDGSHWLITNHLRLNDVLTRVFASWPIFLSLEKYRDYHFRHHRFLGTERDPELESKSLEAPAWDIPISRTRLLSMILIDLTGMGVIWYKRRVILGFFGRRSSSIAHDTKRQDIFSGQGDKKISLDSCFGALYWAIIFGVLWYAGMLWVFGIWILSLMTSFFAAFRLRVWTEHVGIPGTHRFRVTAWQRALFLPHHTWCHFEHHLFPSIPFWNLPVARPLVAPEIPVITLGKVFESFFCSVSIPTGTVLKKSSEDQ